MKLMTKEIEATLPPIYSQDGKGYDAIARVKFFHPVGSWTWFATEYDPVSRTFFGLVQGHEEEFGYFNLDELQAVKGPLGLGIERDLYFTPKPLREVTTNKEIVK